MLLIKTRPKTPFKRLQVKYKFFYKYNFFLGYKTKYKNINNATQLGRNGIKHKKFFSRIELKPIQYNFKVLAPAVITNYGNYKTYIREYTYAKTMYNDNIFLPALFNFHPGFILYPTDILFYLEDVKNVIGQIIPLSWIPINMPVAYIFNTSNKYGAYTRSSGSTSFRQRLDRKEKVIHVLLASNKIKIFKFHINAIFGSTHNILRNKVIEGGWGFSASNNKVIAVRGVAKNPVDHPNGGRTKAKQPELSPWGWIAKRNK